MIDLMKHFANNVDNLSIEQKRLAIRTFVKEIIWDGECTHIVLVGSEYNESLSNIVKTAESINKNRFFL